MEALRLRLVVFLAVAAIFVPKGHSFTPPRYFPKYGKDESGIEFCEKERYVSGPKSTCPFGYSFKDYPKKPECICIRGM
jgi:hypothetical protein